MKKLWLLLGFLGVLGAPVISLEVDEEELTSSLDRTIQFENYAGPVDKFETAQEIRSIGTAFVNQLGRTEDGRLAAGNAGYFGKYRLFHIPPVPGQPGRGADILELLPNAQVDHIDNLRRILSAYLESAYGYSPEDAQTLGVFVTLYNAIHRGAYPRFQERYNGEVMGILRPEHLGIALSYREWPGATQLVIPLAVDSPPGQLSTVPADELASPEVVETLRDQPDRGIEERQQVVDLIDRSVEQETDQIQEQRRILESTQQEPAQPAEETPGSEPSAASEDARSPAQTPGDAAQPRETPEAQSPSSPEQQPQTDSPADSPAAPEVTPSEQPSEESPEPETQTPVTQEQLDQREEELRQAQERSDEIRQETAQDIADLEQPARQVPPVPVVFSDTRMVDGSLRSRYSILDANTGETMHRGLDTEFLGRRLVSTPAGYLGLSLSGDFARLLLVNLEEGQVVQESENIIYTYSDLAYHQEGAVLYAVVYRDGDWYVGGFDEALSLQMISVVTVRPETSLIIKDSVLLVSRKDGRISRLLLDDLRVNSPSGEGR